MKYSSKQNLKWRKKLYFESLSANRLNNGKKIQTQAANLFDTYLKICDHESLFHVSYKWWKHILSEQDSVCHGIRLLWPAAVMCLVTVTAIIIWTNRCQQHVKCMGWVSVDCTRNLNGNYTYIYFFCILISYCHPIFPSIVFIFIT